ncbi:hypothetical protein PsorP6_016298 [Peronosclerospora sorghi]|uniref:Uncharacterized protein n=1 Tax=Peronosclerospora sorghi TaxID=230839 RepID=A0ACC0VPZ3_9STRA|nr:hypothetical protein PsorP6_016298 [Peronosclerospora sorghi]
MTEEGEEERMMPKNLHFLPTAREVEEEVAPVLSSPERLAALAEAEAENKQQNDKFWTHFREKEEAVNLLRQTSVGKEVPEEATDDELLGAVVADENAKDELMKLLEQWKKQQKQKKDEGDKRSSQRIRKVDKTMIQGWGIKEDELIDNIVWLGSINNKRLSKLGRRRLRHMALGKLYFDRSSIVKGKKSGEGTSGLVEGIEREIMTNADFLAEVGLELDVVMKWAQEIYQNEGSKLSFDVIVDMGIGKAFFDAVSE